MPATKSFVRMDSTPHVTKLNGGVLAIDDSAMRIINDESPKTVTAIDDISFDSLESKSPKNSYLNKLIKFYKTTSMQFLNSGTSNKPLVIPSSLTDKEGIQESIEDIIPDESTEQTLLQLMAERLPVIARQLNLTNQKPSLSTSIPKTFIEEKYGNQHEMFCALQQIGVHLLIDLIKNTNIDYNSVKQVMNLHRHMTARAQGASEFRDFGIPINNQRAHVVTNLSDQFPSTAKEALSKFDTYKDCTMQDFVRFSRVFKSTIQHTYEYAESIKIEDLDIKVIVLDEDIRRINSSTEIPLSLLVRAPDPTNDEEHLLWVIHGENLIGDGMKMCIEDELSSRFEQIRDVLQSNRELTEQERDMCMEYISIIAFLECQLTSIIRGGGSVPEMLTDGLSEPCGLQRVSRREGYNLWGATMSFPTYSEFKASLYEQIKSPSKVGAHSARVSKAINSPNLAR